MGTNDYLVRDVTQHGRPTTSQRCVNYQKALPQGTTFNIFTVSAPIVVTGLFGVISTVWGGATKLGIGVTGAAAAIAAQPGAGAAGALGAVVIMPTTIGAALPTPITASGQAASSGMFVMYAAAITITADTSTTGNITWVLEYASMYLKTPATVAAA